MSAASTVAAAALFIVSGLLGAAGRLCAAAMRTDAKETKAVVTTTSEARDRIVRERAALVQWERGARRGRAAAPSAAAVDEEVTSSRPESADAVAKLSPSVAGVADHERPEPVATGEVVVTRVVGASSVLPANSNEDCLDTVLEPKLSALRRFSEVNRAVGKHGEPGPFQALCLAGAGGFHVMVGMESFDGDLSRDGLLQLAASAAGCPVPAADSEAAGLVVRQWSEVRARRAELRCEAWEEFHRLLRDGAATRVHPSAVTALFAAHGRVCEWRRGDNPELDAVVSALDSLEAEIAGTIRRTIRDE